MMLGDDTVFHPKKEATIQAIRLLKKLVQNGHNDAANQLCQEIYQEQLSSLENYLKNMETKLT